MPPPIPTSSIPPPADRSSGSESAAASREDKADPDDVPRPPSPVPVWKELPHPVMNLPPYLLVLGTITFVLYTALYVADLIVLYWIFLPTRGLGRAIAVVEFIDRTLVTPLFGDRTRAFMVHLLQTSLRAVGLSGNVQGMRESLINIPIWSELVAHRDTISHIFRPYLDSRWGLFVNLLGSQYVSVGTIRHVDGLLQWSFWLDVCAFSSAVVLLVCLSFPDNRLAYGKGDEQPSSSSWPWLSTKYFIVILIAAFYFKLLVATFIFLAMLWCFWCFWPVQILTSAVPHGLRRNLPSSCGLQLALSLYRLQSLDPYRHQIQLYSGVFEVFFFFSMLGLMKKSTEYWHRCNIEYVDAIMETRYPDLYEFAAEKRNFQRTRGKSLTWSWIWVYPANLVALAAVAWFAYEKFEPALQSYLHSAPNLHNGKYGY